jgi:glycosyltransferase involved in cell wall biosynthesis
MLVYAFYESDTRVLQYAKALAERGDSVDVIALRRQGKPHFEMLDGVNVYRIQSRELNERGKFTYLLRILKFLVLAGVVLARKHLAKAYDVIHVHSVPDFLVFATALPKLMGARVILDIHDILPEFYASKFGIRADSLTFRSLVLVEKLSTTFADHVIIANDLWHERLVSRSVKASKCTVFLNYPDSTIFYWSPRSSGNDKFIIMYPGTLNAHQGVDVAIRAFARVAEEMPEAEIHIYGEGPARLPLIKLKDDLQVGDRVIFHSILPVNEIATIMAKADLAVVPKRASSGFGNEAASTKIMEFMSLGVPLIVSRTRIDAYYHDETRVQFFESENDYDLADKMLLLRNDQKRRSELASNALRYVEEHCWKEKRKEYLALIDFLVARTLPSRTRDETRSPVVQA